jgi:hypothetical protein
LFIWFVWFIWLVSFNQTDETDKITKQTGLMRGAGWFRAEPGGVLEDALRTGVVDELLATDETLLHLYSAPGAESIGEIS